MVILGVYRAAYPFFRHPVVGRELCRVWYDVFLEPVPIVDFVSYDPAQDSFVPGASSIHNRPSCLTASPRTVHAFPGDCFTTSRRINYKAIDDQVVNLRMKLPRWTR